MLSSDWLSSLVTVIGPFVGTVGLKKKLEFRGGWGGWLGCVKCTPSQIIYWYNVPYPKLHLPTKFHPNRATIAKVSYLGWFRGVWGGGWGGLNMGRTLYVFLFSCIPPKVTSMQNFIDIGQKIYKFNQSIKNNIFPKIKSQESETFKYNGEEHH